MKNVWRAGLVLSFSALVACSDTSGTSSTVTPPVTGTPAHVPGALAYFEGNYDGVSGTVSVRERVAPGELAPQANLPYGQTSGNIFFHTCGTPSWSAPTLSATVQAVNLMSGTEKISAYIDGISGTGVTLSSGPSSGASLGTIATYGETAANSANCASNTATWSFSNPGGSSFYFYGHAVGNAQTPTVPTSGLIARWKLDEGTGTTANDISGNGFTGTYVNGTWQTSNNCILGACAQFSGVGGSSGSYNAA